MPDCLKCGAHFPNWVSIDGVKKNLASRKYCLDCSPWGEHNTKPLHGNTGPTSKIYQVPEEEFRKIVAKSPSYSAAIRSIGMFPYPGHYRTLKRRIAECGIDVSHMVEGRAQISRSISRAAGARRRRPISDYLVEHSSLPGVTLKKRLIAEGFIEEKCDECGMGPEWNDKPLSLHLDHINGVHDDARPENLRLLCPNCHSQTDTYAGRNRKKRAGVPQ